MSEIKLCEKRIVMGVVDGVGMPDQWFPLDPQPCCENCKHAQISKYADLCEEIDGRIPELSFYCKYWERKE